MAVLNKYHGNIPAGALYIGRGSKWGNPFIIGKDGDRDAVCEKHEAWLDQQIEAGEITDQDLAQLHGRDLVCYCAPARCHGDTLERYAKDAVLDLVMAGKPIELPKYKLLVAGGRDFDNNHLMDHQIDLLVEIELKDFAVSIVSGMARGADRLAYEFAKERNIVCHEFPADWGTNGKRAGFMRNEKMGQFANGALIFWDGKSRGTKHMIHYMRGLGKDVRVISY